MALNSLCLLKRVSTTVCNLFSQGSHHFLCFHLEKAVEFRIGEVEDDLLSTSTLVMCQAIVSNRTVMKCLK